MKWFEAAGSVMMKGLQMTLRNLYCYDRSDSPGCNVIAHD